MYRFRERPHNHRRLYLVLLGFVVIACVVTFAVSRLLRSNTELGRTPPPVTSTVSATTVKVVTMNEPLFSLALPEDWKPRSSNDVPQPTYSWHGTTKDDNTRWLNVYVDNAVPTTLAVNRVLPVEANGNSLTLTTDVSDNCTTFTRAPTSGNSSVVARWQGITFLCDTGNYLRDVVGTSSPDGVNIVTLTSADKGSHKFFFTYTDNSSSPDYSIFTDALKSFQLK